MLDSHFFTSFTACASLTLKWSSLSLFHREDLQTRWFCFSDVGERAGKHSACFFCFVPQTRRKHLRKSNLPQIFWLSGVTPQRLPISTQPRHLFPPLPLTCPNFTAFIPHEIILSSFTFAEAWHTAISNGNFSVAVLFV